MESETKESKTTVGEMHKRREKMADEKRYIIYYTFGEEPAENKSPNVSLEAGNQKTDEVSENV